MFKKPKSKLTQSIAAQFLGITVLLGALGLGYLARPTPVLAAECDEIGTANLSSTLDNRGLLMEGGGKFIIADKDSNTPIGVDEPVRIYFEGVVKNEAGNPNWANCSSQLNKLNYVIGFYIYPQGSHVVSQQGGATVAAVFSEQNGGILVRAGFSTTIKQLWDAQNLEELTGVDIYAYVCPGEEGIPATDQCDLVANHDDLGFVTLKVDGKASNLNAQSINEDIFKKNEAAISTPAYVHTYVGSSRNTSVPGTLLSYVASFISVIIQVMTTLIYWLFAFVIAPLIEAVLSIHPYKDIFVQVIYPGWLILRNLSNILFIVVLLIIGMATLFQVEKYSYKHLLVQVIIAAVAVNFSLVIGQSVLGIADTVQNQFLPDRSNVVRALGYELMVRPIQLISQQQTATTSTGQGFANLTYPFFLFALALGAFFCFVAILVFLVVRIVGLWILLMVSPAAYVANVLPATHKYFEEWWNKFLSYAFITPIFAFFLNIAALFANSHVLSKGSDLYDKAALGVIPASVQDFVFLAASHITVLVFLFAGLAFAGSTGVVGAKAMTEFAKKGMSKPFTFAGSKLNQWKTEKTLGWTQPDKNDNFLKKWGKNALFAATNPDIAYKGFSEQSKEKTQRLARRAEGRGFDVSRQFFGGPSSEQEMEAIDHEAEEHRKTHPYRDEDSHVAESVEAIERAMHNPRNTQYMTEVYGQMLDDFKNKSGNELMVQAARRLGMKEEDVDASPKGFLNFMNQLVEKKALSEELAVRFMERITDTAFANGEMWYGWGVYTKDHKRHIAKADDNDEGYQHMIDQQQKKLEKKEPQERGRTMHHSAVADQTEDNRRLMSDLGAYWIATANQTDYDQSNRANKEMVRAFVEAIREDRNLALEKIGNKMAEQYEHDKGIKLTDDQREKMAEAKLQEFQRKYLRTDIHGNSIPKEETNRLERLEGKNTTLRSYITAIGDNTARNDIRNEVNANLQNYSSYKYDLENSTQNKITSAPGADLGGIRDSVAKSVADDLAQRLTPRQLGISGVSSSDLDSIHNDISDAVKRVASSNGGRSLGDMAGDLNQAVKDALSASSAFNQMIKGQTKYSESEIIDRAANNILAGIEK